MQDNFDFANYAVQVRKTAVSLLSSGFCDSDIAGSMYLLTTAIERDLVRFGEPSESSHVVCGPGCGTCCVLNVDVLLPEAIAIVRFLKKSFSEEILAKLALRLNELQQRTRWMDDEERIFLREPCAFLDDRGYCIIHAVRPLLCRSITSTDSDACREAINMLPLGASPSVEMNLFQKYLLETVYRELAEALKELELDDRPRRLSFAIHSLLDEPKLVDSFLAGRVSRH